MILLDTCVLIDALTGSRRSAPALRAFIADGERLAISTLVLYEWLRGPRVPSELAAQEALLPSEAALEFGPREAKASAEIYRAVKSPRARSIDIAIAASAIAKDAALWTLNEADFQDIPGLRIVGRAI